MQGDMVGGGPRQGREDTRTRQRGLEGQKRNRSLVLVCLDTNLLVALLRGDDSAAKVVGGFEDSGKPLRTTAITEYELFKGAHLSSRREENLQRWRRPFDGTEELSRTDE